MTANTVQLFANGLRSRSEETRLKAARELKLYVSTDLKEISADELVTFMDDFNKQILEMVSSPEVHDKKGAILAIVSLIDVDVGNISTRHIRFANYLRNLLPHSDVGVIEMAANTIGKLALASGALTAEYVEFEVKRAFEWLTADRQESRRHAAVSVLRELAVSLPTFFFQQVQQFFDCIFNAIRDPKSAIREGAAAALRAVLVITSQREAKQKDRPPYYKLCFEELERQYDETAGREKKLSRDDWAHGSLLITLELLRFSNVKAEEKRRELDRKLNHLPTEHEQTFQEMSLTKSMINWSRLAHFQEARSQSNQSAAELQLSSPPYEQTILESRSIMDLMTERYNRICIMVLKLKTIKNSNVQITLLSVLPRLAMFNPTTFNTNHLEETMRYLLGALKSREKSATLIAIGFLAVALGLNIRRHLPAILAVIRQMLPTKEAQPKKQKSISVDPAVFSCITMLVIAVGADKSAMTKDIKELIDSMFAAGLSPSLTSSLDQLAQTIPELRKDIQDGLLKMLSLVLIGRPLRHPGAPRGSSSRQSVPSSASSLSLSDTPDVTSITLALHTLGNFDFEGYSLVQFVTHCASQYLTHDNKEVRMETVKTCSRLLTPLLADLAEPRKPVSMASMGTVSTVLGRLMATGVTDEDADVRYCVFISLDDKFDPHLAQPENLQLLFMSLNDEVFEIRELAICIIGRLCNKNPAYVMPFLRKVLIQILTELEHSGISRNKEQGARLLGHLITRAPQLIRSYIEPILTILIPKMEEVEPSPSVVISIMSAIGDLAEVSGTDMRKWSDNLVPILLDIMQDSMLITKREIALWTLGQVIESTAYVVEPYQKYPNLIDILFSFLRSQQTMSIRREVVRVLGILGALDPHKHKIYVGQIGKTGELGAVLSMSETKPEQDGSHQGDINTSEMLINMTSGNLEDYYPAITIAYLMKYIRDPGMSQHYTMIVQSVTFIFKSLGIKCVPYLNQVIPAYLHVIRLSEQSFREFLFQQLGVIVAIVKQHIRNYLDDIFGLIKEYWIANCSLQNTIILLLEQIVAAIGCEFKMFLPQLVPYILKVFTSDVSASRTSAMRMLSALQIFGENIGEFLHLLLPPIIKVFDSQEVNVAARKLALETIDHFTDSLDLTEFAARIIHPIVRTLDNTSELRKTAMDTLASLVRQLNRQYLTFIPMVSRVVTKHRISHHRYEMLEERIVNGSGTIYSELDDEYVSMRFKLNKHRKSESILESPDTAQIKKLHVSSANLQRAWVSTKRVSRDDWLEWLRRLGIELLKESPNPALRSCWPLANAYNPLARELFNAAFVSCWTELSESQQDELIQNIEQALAVPDMVEITQTLLNLAEFLDHCDKGVLPLDSSVLADRAMKCRAFAKALHYKEEEFHKGPTNQILESLISINNKLQQPEAAIGVLEYARKHHRADLKVQERWYEKLHEWDKALNAYERQQEKSPDDSNFLLGRMRCLEALGEWGRLHEITTDKWQLVDNDVKEKMARMSATAAWGMGHWQDMVSYACKIPLETYDSYFYQSVISLHANEFHKAQQSIDKARDMLVAELSTLAGESYSRAYSVMVNVQMLSELEEVIQYKLVPERRDTIKDMWWNRLRGCQNVLEDWQRLLQIRSLVIDPKDDLKTWLKYASLCRKNGRVSLASRTLNLLMGEDASKMSDANLVQAEPHIAFAYMKHLWNGSTDKKQDALKKLTLLADTLAQTNSPKKQLTDINQHLAKCYLKLGEWKEGLDGQTDTTILQVIKHYEDATRYNKDWYKAWHAFAYANYEAVVILKEKKAPTDSTAASSSGETSKTDDSNLATYLSDFCRASVKGFFRSISLSAANSLQDTLRLLTLWFEYGHWADVNTALVEGIKTVQIDNWIQVIPQLIARIDTPRQLISRLIIQLLMDIGKQHPQAIVYPLTVVTKSTIQARSVAANMILKSMCEHSNRLVQQSMLISEELIRVAILWHEQWHESLEEASRLWFGDKNVSGMMKTLDPLHKLLDDGPQTLKETAFNQMYGRDLSDAREWCRKYKTTKNMKDITAAWDLYYNVFRKISKQLPQLTTLELQYVSPKLLLCRDMELAVPGTYDPNQPVVKIRHISANLQVITSKQRPRKLSIFGDNGQEYQFLLKGHEDLRQDERVMQVFGLFNSLLLNNPETLRRNLTIQRYSVIPLSTNSGLIGWVPNCDTLHSLIRDYREKKKILLNIEHRIMLRMAPDYDRLMLMQKVEVFEHALESTNGDDLARILWTKSPSSEVWFDRRTNYTRSLAVMSMVGYVLGLGDRHPSNLMLDRMSGKIMHIDFGDCFEVAMVREKFPEKIPFRLTRMLINAMEVTGIDGNYRMTCESVMEVLRNHKDSVMAVLEAFCYDPLFSWRFTEAQNKDHKQARSGIEQVSLIADPLSNRDPSNLDSQNMSTMKKAFAGRPTMDEDLPQEELNKKAVVTISRVRDKLTGRDFGTKEPMDVPTQVTQLVMQATSHENLCQCYIGCFQELIRSATNAHHRTVVYENLEQRNVYHSHALVIALALGRVVQGVHSGRKSTRVNFAFI